MGVGLGQLVDDGTGTTSLAIPYLTFLAPGLLAATAMMTGAGDASWPVMAGIKWRKTNDFSDLHLDPLEGRIGRYVEVGDATSADFHHDEHVDGRKHGGVLRHEVAREESVAMILNECAPCLPITAWSPRRHVLANGARGMADTKLDAQLFVYLVLTPGWVVAAHASDELDVLGWNSRPSPTLRARPPSPVEPEALTVPGEHGLGLHNDERR